MNNITLRNEREEDFRVVEELTREAFWNLYIPGCEEHYIVHIMRDHPDFIKYLDFVAVSDGKIIGNIMYTKSFIIDDSGRKTDTITFGPLCVHPEYQNQGVGSALINHSKKVAAENGHSAIITGLL